MMQTNTVLEDILHCPNLPSLPAVAVRVIELTQDPDVSMDELAATIQNDQALAAKVLRTVNSSFYGLRERCASIRKAIVLLGLSPVKSLTLGFSLVSSVDSTLGPTFDFTSHWRRSLFAAVGAKLTAEAAGHDFADEAFLAGLLQDIGVVAMYTALGDAYLEIIERTQGDHAKLVRAELEALELQHPEVGAMLAQRWRLPNELVMPIRYHERPTAAPNEAAAIVRTVAMGNFACDVMSSENPVDARRRFYQRAESWFKLDTQACDALLCKINTQTEQMSEFFGLDTGEYMDNEEVLASAEQQIIALGREQRRGSFAVEKLEELLKDEIDRDAVTALPSRRGFEKTLELSFSAARDELSTLGLAQIAIGGIGDIRHQTGDEPADELVLAVVATLHKHFEPLGGIVCRLGGSVFSVIAPGISRREFVAHCEAAQSDIARAGPAWAFAAGAAGYHLTVSIGLAIRDPEDPASPASRGALLEAANTAVKAARLAGGSRLEIHGDRTTAEAA